MPVWFSEEECFASLLLFLGFLSEEDSPTRRAAVARMERHEQECKGHCGHNVRIRAAQSVNPVRKSAFEAVFTLFILTYMERSGLTHKVTDAPEGRYFRTKVNGQQGFPSGLPASAMEFFVPADSAKRAHFIVDVERKELFDDPRPLIQHLDVTASREVKFFPPDTGELHWRQLVDTSNARLMVRWNGMVKEIAPDCGLLGRYSKLLRRESVRDPVHEEAEDKTRRPTISIGEDALRLRDLVLGYSEDQSWLCGHLQQMLTFRKVDNLRRRSRDPLKAPVALDQVELDDEAGQSDEGTLVEQPRQLTQPAPAPQQHPDHMNEGVHRLDRLRSHLRGVQRQVFDLKRGGLTDEAVGARLGIRRETANRHLRRIKKTAATLNL